MKFTYKKRNIEIENIEKVIYLRTNGNDENDGESKTKAVKTLKIAFDRIRNIVAKTGKDKIVLDIGNGDFYAERLPNYGAYITSDHMWCGCYIDTNYCHIVGDGYKTNIIINPQQDGFIGGRQYYFSGENNNIVTNCNFIINASDYSGSYQNALFTWCSSKFLNNAFFITTNSMSYNYCNDDYGADVENCMFFGNYSVCSDYSGKPNFKNCMFFDNEPKSNNYSSDENINYSQNLSEEYRQKYLNKDKSLPLFKDMYKWICFEFYTFISNNDDNYIIKDNLRTKLPNISKELIKSNSLDFSNYMNIKNLFEDKDRVSLLVMKNK